MTQYPGNDIERASRGVRGARVVGVRAGSPAYDAGFEPGCVVTAVDGQPLRDIIDWRWLSADDEMEVGYVDLDGDAGRVTLYRDEGEDWGFEFDGVVFDEVRLCRNACVFCFMRQLPDGLRPSLTLRDDDYRLSFLSGTFVTLTNLTPEDERRIVEQRLTPLRFSLHASNPAVRASLIGKHAAHGLAALDRLLAAGIEFHSQIVLCPGLNDGAALRETLSWAYARPGILSVGIVPLGYTRHQQAFSESYNDAQAAQQLLGDVEPFQLRALEERGDPWVYAADEFYLNAYGKACLDHVPPTSWYGDFSMFEDGIGIVRSCADDWDRAREGGAVDAFRAAMRASGRRVVLVSGRAQEPFLGSLIERAGLGGCLEPLFVDNAFFGGNVDVTGLLVGCDIAAAVRAYAADRGGQDPIFAIPRIVVNDQGLLLDGMTVRDMEIAAGCPLRMVSCNASEYLVELACESAS